jgi:hypothetical protein
VSLYEIIFLIISSLSLLVSLTVGYFAYFQAAKPKILIGSNLILFNSATLTPTEEVWGGVTFVLPLTFYNWSPKGGSIQQVRLIIGQKDNPKEYFDMAWSNFVKFVDGVTWEDEDVAQPIAISGRSSVTKFVRFDWSPLAGEKLHLKPSQYEMTILVWTNSNVEKPNLVEERSFYITEVVYTEYQATVSNQMSFGFWIPIDDNRRINSTINRADINKIYK